MQVRTYLTWQHRLISICACAISISASVNYSLISTAAPVPVKAASKSERISQKITNLKQSQQRWIEINLKEQKLLVWSGNELVYQTKVSTGKRSTPTLTGIFAVQTKLPVARMRGADYDIPDVPSTMYYDGNYAIHGAYWHKNFGTPVSHGCVNLPPKKAKWVFDWAKVGTPVIVRK
jgi:lipoprotein-anchoring transpeptidase ErfK/SrfK